MESEEIGRTRRRIGAGATVLLLLILAAWLWREALGAG
jgi:hypothetical protein